MATQDNRRTKTVEYAIYRGEDVDHVSWREAKLMAANLNSFAPNSQWEDVTLIERVTRHWIAEELEDQEEETLYTQEAKVG